MPLAYLTRREQFNAAHRLYKEGLTDLQNYELYGKCSNPNWHGHNYILLVTVKGEINSDTGYIVNLKELSSIIKEEVVDKIDHKNLNLEVDFMKGIIPSTENLVVAVWNQLKPRVEKLGIALYCIKIKETENNFAEYYGE